MSDSGQVSVVSTARATLEELSELIDVLGAADLSQLVDEVIDAEKVMVAGAGRSGLMARAVAMRLMHTGLEAFAAGEVATPAIASGDLLIAFSARASRGTVAQLKTAREVGARTALVTTARDEHTTSVADLVVEVPARTKVATDQHAGSLFEQACLIVGDAVAKHVRLNLGVPESVLDARHANL